MKLFISGIEKQLQNRSLKINRIIGEPSTISFRVITPKSDPKFATGSKVEIKDDLNNLIFSGSIEDSYKQSNETKTKSIHVVSCIDNHYFTEKRIHAKVYKDKYTGEIVEAMTDEVLNEEGIYYFDDEVQNLIVNGDFSDGANGWFASKGTISNGMFSTGDFTNDNPYIYQNNLAIDKDDILYIEIMMKVSSIDREIPLFDGRNTSAIVLYQNVTIDRFNEWVRYTYYEKVTDNITQFYFGTANALRTGNFQIKEIKMYNLTKMHNAGNEPTLEKFEDKFSKPIPFNEVDDSLTPNGDFTFKNLFDVSQVIAGSYYTSLGDLVVHSTSCYSPQYIKIDNTIPYKWNGMLTTGKQIIINTYDENLNHIERLLTYHISNRYGVIFDELDFDSNVEYVRISAYYEGVNQLDDFEFGINPVSQITIPHKNLCDNIFESGSFDGGTGNLSPNTTTIRSVNYMTIDAGNYTMSRDIGTGQFGYVWDSSYNYLGNIGGFADGEDILSQFPTAKYLKVVITGLTNTDVTIPKTQVQVEKGTQKTTYEDYVYKKNMNKQLYSMSYSSNALFTEGVDITTRPQYTEGEDFYYIDSERAIGGLVEVKPNTKYLLKVDKLVGNAQLNITEFSTQNQWYNANDYEQNNFSRQAQKTLIITTGASTKWLLYGVMVGYNERLDGGSFNVENLILTEYEVHKTENDFDKEDFYGFNSPLVVTQLEKGIKIVNNDNTKRYLGVTYIFNLKPNTEYTFMRDINIIKGTINQDTGNIHMYLNETIFNTFSNGSNIPITFTTDATGILKLVFSANWGLYEQVDIEFTNIMLNEGNTAKPYIPYGVLYEPYGFDRDFPTSFEWLGYNNLHLLNNELHLMTILDNDANDFFRTNVKDFVNNGDYIYFSFDYEIVYGSFDAVYTHRNSLDTYREETTRYLDIGKGTHKEILQLDTNNTYDYFGVKLYDNDSYVIISNFKVYNLTSLYDTDIPTIAEFEANPQAISRKRGRTWIDTTIDKGKLYSKYFDFIYCDKILDELAKFSYYIWFIDNDKCLHFKDPTLLTNLQELNDNNIKMGSMKINDNRAKYRNVQYLKGTHDASEIKLEEFTYKSDDVNQFFSVLIKVFEIDYIEIDRNGDNNWSKVKMGGATEYIRQKYVDPTAVDGAFLWAKDDYIINYNRFGDWELVNGVSKTSEGGAYLLNDSSKIRISYKGIIPTLIIAANSSEIERVRNIENGGSGKVEVYQHDPDITTKEQATAFANSQLELYGTNDNYSVKLTTLTPGYEEGYQVRVNSAIENFDETMLIERVKISAIDGLVWYELYLVKGAIFDSWNKFFKSTFEMEKTVTQEEFTLDDPVPVPKFYFKDWSVGDMGSPFSLKPAVGLKPASGLYPNMAGSARFRYCEITYIDDLSVTKTKRIEYTTHQEQTDSLITIHYVAPYECVGDWQKIEWYASSIESSELGFGALVDSDNTINFTKTIYETVQIQRTDTKL